MGGIRNFQNCARCRNHGIKNILRGHKKFCEFKQCSCEKCLATKDRQSFIAREIAMHRYEIKNQNETKSPSKGLKLNLVRSKPMVDQSTVTDEFWTARSPKVCPKFNKSNGEIRKDQQCSRCRNHGKVKELFELKSLKLAKRIKLIQERKISQILKKLISLQFQLLRGHKNDCPFGNCVCSKCEITMKRREIMAKQIKDYRNLKTTDGSLSSPEALRSPEISQDFGSSNYEPMEDQDCFFMIQSLYEKYANKSSEYKIQLIYAFAHLANGNWNQIEEALEKGEKLCQSINKSCQ